MECSGKHRGLGVHLSFVRSVTMDKWKDIELEKMKVGGNRQAKEFLNSQPDYNASMNLQQRYNSRAAALLRDKITNEAQGKSWSIQSSSAQNYSSSYAAPTLRETPKVKRKTFVFSSSHFVSFSPSLRIGRIRNHQLIPINRDKTVTVVVVVVVVIRTTMATTVNNIHQV